MSDLTLPAQAQPAVADNAQPQTFKQPANTAVVDRQQAWGDLATQQFNTSDDLYQTTKPSSVDVGTDGQYDYKPKVGILNAFVKGLPSDKSVTNPYPYDPSYQASFGESLAAGLTSFVRNGVEAGMDLYSPEMKAARDSVEQLRKFDPQGADNIEEQMLGGARLSDTKLKIKLGASIGEAALTVLPFFKVGRAAAATVEAASLTKLGKFGAAVAESPILSKLYGGGLNGMLYGGLYGLHEYDADWKQATLNAAMGGVFGAGLIGVGSALGFAGKYAGTKVLEGAGAVLSGANKALADALPAKWYSAVFSVGSALSKYYGDIGENFGKMWRQATREGTEDLGRVQLGLIDHGLIEPPPGMKGVGQGVEFVGNNQELMTKYNQILRGQGAYADARIQAEAIQADPRLQYLDGLRKTYGAASMDAKITDNLLNMETYLPKHTPVVDLSNESRAALAKATTPAERESIFAANDPMVREMVENSVLYEKKFGTLADSYKQYYDWTDIVNNNNRVSLQENTFLQSMVGDGRAKTLEDARSMVLADISRRKEALTPRADSLDFKRKVDLPWYDPNPSRVMPTYVFDASMRIGMAKTFGANDEVIQSMLKKVKETLVPGMQPKEAAKTFEDFARTVTGQIERSPSMERASSAIRAIQTPKLSFSQMINLGQSANTLLASDFGATMHGISMAFSTQGQRNAIERGVLLNGFMRQISSYNSGGSALAESLMKYSGFTYTEMFNRVVGSNAADHWVESNLQKVLAEKTGGAGKPSFARSALQELGLPVDDIIARGSISSEEKALAAQAFVEKTQFLGHPIDLPYFASSPTGKVLFQFKTFAYQQARFVTHELKNSFGKGYTSRGVRNLLILGTVFPMTGEVLSDVRSLITQEKRPTKALDRYVADIFAAGTYGLFYDFYKSAESGKLGTAIAGPTVGDAIGYLETTAQAISNPSSGLKAFSKKLLQQTGVGRVGVNTFYPTSNKGKSTLQSLIEWSGDEE